MLLPNDHTRRWEILSTEYLIRRPWLTARRDKVLLPDGRINPEYYVVEYPDWVNVIAITRDGQFVMERQYRHAVAMTCYELPCGVMEEGETPLQAAQRELLEETGYTGGEWTHLLDITPNPSEVVDNAGTIKRVTSSSTDVIHTDNVYNALYNAALTMENRLSQSLMLTPLLKYFSGL